MGSEQVVSIFLGRSNEERDASERLIAQEDTIFDEQPNEAQDLATHVRSDSNRFKLLNRRQQLSAATSERKSNRNFWATIIIGGAIFVKTDFHGLAAIAQFLLSI